MSGAGVSSTGNVLSKLGHVAGSVFKENADADKENKKNSSELNRVSDEELALFDADYPEFNETEFDLELCRHILDAHPSTLKAQQGDEADVWRQLYSIEDICDLLSNYNMLTKERAAEMKKDYIEKLTSLTNLQKKIKSTPILSDCCKAELEKLSVKQKKCEQWIVQKLKPIKAYTQEAESREMKRSVAADIAIIVELEKIKKHSDANVIRSKKMARLTQQLKKWDDEQGKDWTKLEDDLFQIKIKFYAKIRSNPVIMAALKKLEMDLSAKVNVKKEKLESDLLLTPDLVLERPSVSVSVAQKRSVKISPLNMTAIYEQMQKDELAEQNTPSLRS